MTTIKYWMWNHITDYIDPNTGEVNCTLLAESACSKFNGYVGDAIPEEYFDLAFKVSEEHRMAKNG